MIKAKRFYGYGEYETVDGDTHEAPNCWALVNEQDKVLVDDKKQPCLYWYQWKAAQEADKLNGTVFPEIKSIRGEDLFKVRVGQMVVSCTGPGDHPSPGLCARVGVVVGHEKNKYGISLAVEWEGRKPIDMIDLLHDPAYKSGAGVYVYPSLRLAIS